MLIEAEDAHFALVQSGEAPAGLTLAPGNVAPPEILAMLRALAAEVAGHYRPSAWWIVEEDEIAGLCSLKTPPSEDGVVEIGYGIAPLRQGRGIATRAIADLLAWAATASVKLRAETAVANIASQRVLTANGFVQTGTRHDPEDGDLICWSADSGC